MLGNIIGIVADTIKGTGKIIGKTVNKNKGIEEGNKTEREKIKAERETEQTKIHADRETEQTKTHAFREIKQSEINAKDKQDTIREFNKSTQEVSKLHFGYLDKEREEKRDLNNALAQKNDDHLTDIKSMMGQNVQELQDKKELIEQQKEQYIEKAHENDKAKYKIIVFELLKQLHHEKTTSKIVNDELYKKISIQLKEINIQNRDIDIKRDRIFIEKKDLKHTLVEIEQEQIKEIGKYDLRCDDFDNIFKEIQNHKEYKHNMDKDQYRAKYQSKKNRLKIIEDDIFELELSLLELENDKINCKEKLKQKTKEHNEIEYQYKELNIEAEKVISRMEGGMEILQLVNQSIEAGSIQMPNQEFVALESNPMELLSH